jgi:hypothetical protein
MAFRSLKYTYVGKKMLEANQCGSGSEIQLFSFQICGFAICGLGQQENLQICDLRTWTPRNFGFAICGLALG